MVGYRSCCNDDSKCSGVPETCHCDELCYTLDDCCGDIEEICDSSGQLKVQMQWTTSGSNTFQIPSKSYNHSLPSLKNPRVTEGNTKTTTSTDWLLFNVTA